MPLDHSSTALGVWDVVRVPFPYTDRPVRQHRPALVVSTLVVSAMSGPGLAWVLMITSAENRGWPGDVPVSDLSEAGLPAQSVIRTEKVATVDERGIDRIGRLPMADRIAVTAQLQRHLAGAGWP
jgi:mRNA interferase MazF